MGGCSLDWGLSNVCGFVVSGELEIVYFLKKTNNCFCKFASLFFGFFEDVAADHGVEFLS